MYQKKLQKLGLTQGEAKVYEALLVLGPSTVGPIVKKSGVAYSNIYEILNRLLDKGLVSFILKEKTKYFQVEGISRLNDYLTFQEKELKERRQIFDEIYSELENLKSIEDKKEEAKIFIGEKGLMTAYEMLLKGSDKNDNGFFFYVHDDAYYERAERFYVKSWHLIKKYKNRWKGISQGDFRKTRLAKKYPSFIEQKYVSFPVPGNIDFINDKILITTWQEKPVAILIYSKEIVESYKKYFLAVWDQAKK